jgi:hypothetical protein
METLPALAASSVARETFRDPRGDEQQQSQKPAEHPKGPDKADRVGAGRHVCAEPNLKSPCSYGEDQAKEINGTSGVPESFKTVLHLKPLAALRLKNETITLQKHIPLNS